jgi:hypothetical protein
VPFLAVDVYLHEKFNRNYIGYNIRGYRGELLGKKKPGVFRVAFLGGSTALGYGVGPRQTLPYLVQEGLRGALGQDRAEVANLAWNVQGVYSFPFTLRAYRDLKPDVYVFYQGYTDGGINTSNWREESLVFRWTGYMPIWPLIFREKAGVILSGGQLEDFYRNKIRFTPSLGKKVVAQGLVGMADASDSMARILSAWAEKKAEETPDSFKDPANPWAFYLAQTQQSIEIALAQGGKVLLLGQPRIGVWHEQQQTALHRFWREKYSANPRVGYLDLAGELDLKDPQLAPDGMHLSLKGHQQLAPLLVPVLLQMRGED